MIFKNKNVIVTGGSRGIGLAVAEAFCREGARVLAVARSKTELRSAQKKMAGTGGSYEVLAADVSRKAGREKIRAHIIKKMKSTVLVLVNAAGIYGPIGLLEKNNEREWERTFEVNVFGTAHISALVLPFMKRKKCGRIINFSGGGEGPRPRFTAYSASKGAIVRFTESLAAETKEFGITANAITPGGVNTKFLNDVLAAGPKKSGEDFYRQMREQKRTGGVPPEEAAKLVLYLAGDLGRFLSGKVISAHRDSWERFGEHEKELASSDVYTFRRIKPEDRGYEWQ